MSNVPFWKDSVIKRFECPKGMSVKTFAVRELTVADDREIDQNVALFWPKSKDGVSQKANVYEAIRRSLVEVDGKPVDSAVPYTGMDKWTQKTMNFVIQAYLLVNGSAQDSTEENDLLGKAVTIGLDQLGG